jgi:hypothetical protein
MILSGQHTINYTLKGENKRICVKVEMKQKNDLEPSPIIWQTVATINGREIERDDLKYCVNAQLMAEEIAEDRLHELREAYGRSLRIKK